MTRVLASLSGLRDFRAPGPRPQPGGEPRPSYRADRARALPGRLKHHAAPRFSAMSCSRGPLAGRFATTGRAESRFGVCPEDGQQGLCHQACRAPNIRNFLLLARSRPSGRSIFAPHHGWENIVSSVPRACVLHHFQADWAANAEPVPRRRRTYRADRQTVFGGV